VDANNLGKVVLSLPGGEASTELYLFGATVTSWKAAGIERLFVSPKAVFNGVKAIRGGIPLVFPQFGQPSASMPQHGFARTSLWSWACGCHDCAEGEGRIILTLKSSPETMAVWPFDFELTYTVTLTATSLRCELSCLNIGDAAFPAHALLHTYVALPSATSIADLSVKGFQGFTFLDKMAPSADLQLEDRELVTVGCETDRIYCGGEMPDIVLSAGTTPFLTVSKSSSLNATPLATDVVFWNAWADKSCALPDLGEGAYQRYVCVEPGQVRQYVTVAPGDVFSVGTLLRV
jgi:glucose-6-phosphate 1-epimerase